MNTFEMHNTCFTCPLCDGQDSCVFFTEKKGHQHIYHHCPCCDLVFVIPECRLDTESEKSRYELHENDESEHYVNFLSRLATPTLEYLLPQSCGLDFGSGKSQAMAKIFRHAGHDCQCYDIFYYPDPTLLKNKYDFIIASEVIEHLYNPKSVFEQWLSLLDKNGFLAIMTGFRPTDKTFESWWYKNDPTHVVIFSEKTFSFLEQQYGLQRISSSKNVILFRVTN